MKTQTEITRLRCCCCSPENHENPFIADGELRRKADYIIQYSTISRRRIRIADPDCTPPPRVDPQRDVGSPSVSQHDADDVEFILEAVERPPTETEMCGSDATWPPMNGATDLDGKDLDGVDRRRQQTSSPKAAVGDGELDSKAETSTVELDRPTTSLLHGVALSSRQVRGGRCRCCVLQ